MLPVIPFITTSTKVYQSREVRKYAVIVKKYILQGSFEIQVWYFWRFSVRFQYLHGLRVKLFPKKTC